MPLIINYRQIHTSTDRCQIRLMSQLDCLMQVLLPLVPQHSGEHSNAQHHLQVDPPLCLRSAANLLTRDCVAGFPQ